MANVNLALNPYQADQAAIERRRRLAEMMQQQSYEPVQRFSTNGIEAPISWTQGLAKMLQAYQGAKGQQEATEAQKALGQRYQTEGQDALVRGLKAYRGTPENAPESVGGEAVGPTMPAVSGSPEAAIGIWGGHPMTQGVSQAMLANLLMPKTSEKLDLGNKWKVTYSDGRVVYEPKTATPDALLKEGGADRRFSGVSGNTQAQIGSAQKLHATPSGSAVLGARTTLSTHATPSGSAILGAETARRGQDISVDPAIQGALAGAKEGAKTVAEGTAKAALELPQAIATADQGIKLIDQMIGDLQIDENGKLKSGKVKPHPGFSVGVGASAQPGFQYISGTDKASFYALKDQVLGGAFMEAYKTLKGGGQITEIEGKKATSAITRMDTAQSEPEFVKAAREFQDVITKGVSRAKVRAGRRATDSMPTMKFDAQGNLLP